MTATPPPDRSPRPDCTAIPDRADDPDRPEFSTAWRKWRAEVDLDEYEVRWDRMEQLGNDVHGEADLVAALEPRSVLDAGCGMGRVGIELDRRGCDVVGVDLDPDLLARAERRAPHIPWIRHDLATLDLGRQFDVVVLAGNVLPFAERAACPAIVAALARHVAPGGALVLGESLHPGWPTMADLETWSADAGLEIAERYAGWDGPGSDGAAWEPSSAYVVAILRLAA